jgi:hypothetical protein
MPKLRKCRLILLVVPFEPLEVHKELVLLLHDAPVMHPMEIPFFAELVPGHLRLVCDLTGTIQLLTQKAHFLSESSVLQIEIWQHLDVLGLQLATCLELIPFRLEAISRPTHVVLHKEVPKEVVNDCRPFRDLGSDDA